MMMVMEKLTKTQIKAALAAATWEELAAEYAKRLAIRRDTNGGGRPKKLTECARGCGAMLGARELRAHKCNNSKPVCVPAPGLTPDDALTEGVGTARG